MKKLIYKINMAIIGIMVSAPAMAAVNQNGLCKLMDDFKGVFGLIRTLAFIGAAFIIANWAWGFISSGKVEIKDVKDKGTAMLVGFILLFMIGTILSFLMTTSGAQTIGCQAEILNW